MIEDVEDDVDEFSDLDISKAVARVLYQIDNRKSGVLPS